jgi:hypothetical protein
LSVVAKAIAGDGNCQFRAFADLLYGDQERHVEVRMAAVVWLRNNLTFELTPGQPSTRIGLSVAAMAGSTDAYLDNMSKTDGSDESWGDELSLLALSRSYKKIIYVVKVKLTYPDFVERIETFKPEVFDGEPLWLKLVSDMHYMSLHSAVPLDDRLNPKRERSVKSSEVSSTNGLFFLDERLFAYFALSVGAESDWRAAKVGSTH